MTSIPELQQMRTICAADLRDAIDNGTELAVVVCADLLLEIDEELRIRSLPDITPYERRALFMGADPATIYTQEDLKLYQEIKEREAEG